jgi:multidrug efflux pump subunit AcrA (membrane-fusion protein)
MMRSLLRLLLFAAAVGGVVWGTRIIYSPSALATTEGVPAPETTVARQGGFEVVVAATGRLRANRTVTVLSPEREGKVTAIATDGIQVTKGQVICQLDATDFKRDLREKELAYENARAEISKSKADRSLEARNTDAAVTKAREELRILKESNGKLLDQARAQLAFDEANLKRSQTELTRKKRHADERLIPKDQVELAETDLRAKEFAVEKSRKDLALQQEKATSTELQKQTDLENAQFASSTAQRKTVDEGSSATQKAELMRKQMEEARDRVEWCTIRAPASGLLVLSREWRENGQRVTRVGDQVDPQSQLAEIPDLSKMVVSCKLPERDIGGVRLGAPARIRLEEDPERVFHGVVSRISSMAEEIAPWENSGLDPGTRAFTITLDLREKDPKRLLPGITANVEMVAQQLARVIYLPKECVFDQGDRHVVYRWVPISGLGANRWPPEKRRGRLIPTTVTPGRENTQYVVIRRGLRPGERVATQKPTAQASS